jgi:two-component system, OmpR family, sensor histidine kinase KdpD
MTIMTLKSLASTKPLFPTRKRPIGLPILTAVFAAGIFAADISTGLEIAEAVLYVVVVLMSARFCERRGVMLVAAACMALTVLSYVVTPADIKQAGLTPAGLRHAGLINMAMSLLAVALTAVLTLQIESARFAARALAQTEQLRDALIGSVSHELRTPLTSIVAGASILLQSPKIVGDPQIASLASGIRDEAMRLDNDIQSLLDAARITSMGLSTHRDWTDPADLISAAVERTGLRHPDRKIKLNFAGNLPLIHVDPVLVEQALGQILANAAKFSVPFSTIQIDAEVQDRQLLISVRDEGAGLTADEKGKLTERFFRGQRHIGKVPGSGLGMWIANTFIVSSGGKLEASSPGEDQGTTIRIVFPIGEHAKSDVDIQED